MQQNLMSQKRETKYTHVEVSSAGGPDAAENLQSLAEEKFLHDVCLPVPGRKTRQMDLIQLVLGCVRGEVVNKVKGKKGKTIQLSQKQPPKY